MTKIKICGLRRLQDIEAVNRLRPDYVGFVFAKSKRQVTMAEAALLSRELDSSITPVGVYVDAAAEDIAAAVTAGIIRVVQLHGHETLEQLSRLRELLPAGTPVIKAVGMTAGKEQELSRWQQSDVSYLLLDAAEAGSGTVFDHTLIGACEAITKPWFLAGGINQENAADLIRRFAPYGIDVSSGAETDGYKDPKKIEAIIRSVRNE